MNRHHGFYKIGRFEFESKIKAYIFAAQLLKQSTNINNPLSLIKWNFNDEIFSQYDWSIEPETSLDDLYNRRARQLREQYDKVIISYSGGADSHNIIQSFVRQNLHIDEIIVNHLDQGTKNFANVDQQDTSAQYAHASEHYLQAIPRLKELQNILPNTKIRVFDMTENLFNFFTSRDESWIFTMREELNPVDVTRYNYLHFSEFERTVDKGQKMCIIMGIDKPKVLINKDKSVWLRFSDRLTNITPVAEYMKDYTNTTIEYFYWHPDCCDLLCKQAHVVKKWFDLNPQIQQFFSFQPPSSNSVKISRLINERLLRPVIYSTWNTEWFQADKGVFDWYTEFDTWFIHGHVGSSAHNVWKKGIQLIKQSADPFINNNGKYKDGLITMHKDYQIGFLTNTISNK